MRDCIYLSEQLSMLLLRRLPPKLGHALIALLPNPSLHLNAHARCEQDHSIGFTHFVEAAERSLCFCGKAALEADRDTPAPRFEELVIRYFLELEKSVPRPLFREIKENLPFDLLIRMRDAKSVTKDALVSGTEAA